MLNIKKVQNPRTGTVHLVKDDFKHLCGHCTIDAVEIPPAGPKCHCKDCLETLEQMLWIERLQPDYRPLPDVESFDEQRHSM
jgi:hypothetical protein